MTEAHQPWEWSAPTLRSHIEQVRAGRSLSPTTWPNGAQAAVAVSFDCDHETLSLRDGDTTPSALTSGEFGARVGVPRILDLLRRYGIPASFYVPAVSALLRPDEVKDYVANGHEVALHGWIHERNLLLDAGMERTLLLRSADMLERLTDTRPVGIRTPGWTFSHRTLNIIVDLGLSYDSSLMADDAPYEILSHGKPTGVVEIPVNWIRDDTTYFDVYMPPRQVLMIWQEEFREAYLAGGLFQLTMHPHVMGHRSRLSMLSELFEEIVGRGDVWLATHADVAAYCRDSRLTNEPGVPGADARPSTDPTGAS